MLQWWRFLNRGGAELLVKSRPLRQSQQQYSDKGIARRKIYASASTSSIFQGRSADCSTCVTECRTASGETDAMHATVSHEGKVLPS